MNDKSLQFLEVEDVQTMAEISKFVSTFNYPPYLILVMHCFEKYYNLYHCFFMVCLVASYQRFMQEARKVPGAAATTTMIGGGPYHQRILTINSFMFFCFKVNKKTTK